MDRFILITGNIEGYNVNNAIKQLPNYHPSKVYDYETPYGHLVLLSDDFEDGADITQDNEFTVLNLGNMSVNTSSFDKDCVYDHIKNWHKMIF